MFNTHLFSTVHGSNEMSVSTVISGSPPIVRAILIFVGGLVHNVHENSVLRNLRGVGSRNRFANTGNIPVHFKGNCDRRGWNLYKIAWFWY